MKFIQHRGFSGLYPENTKIALEKAKEMYEMEKKVIGVEFDIWPTKGNNSLGPFVIIHDRHTFYLSNSQSFIPVYEMTVSDLKKYTYTSHKLNDSFNLKAYLLNTDQYRKRRSFRKKITSSIMTLEEGLNLFDHKIKIIIELKGNFTAPYYIDYLNKSLELHKQKNIYIKGKNKSLLLVLKKRYPYFKIGILISKEKNLKDIHDSFDFISINNHLVNKSIMKKLIKSNKEIMIWTINNYATFKRFYNQFKIYDYRLNIITDNPDLLVSYYKGLVKQKD